MNTPAPVETLIFMGIDHFGPNDEQYSGYDSRYVGNEWTYHFLTSFNEASFTGMLTFRQLDVASSPKMFLNDVEITDAIVKRGPGWQEVTIPISGTNLKPFFGNKLKISSNGRDDFLIWGMQLTWYKLMPTPEQIMDIGEFKVPAEFKTVVEHFFDWFYEQPQIAEAKKFEKKIQK